MFLNVKKIASSFHEGAFSIRLRRRFEEDRYLDRFAWITLHVVENKIILGRIFFFLFVRSFLIIKIL